MRIVWQTVGRISNEILRVKWFKGEHFHHVFDGSYDSDLEQKKRKVRFSGSAIEQNNTFFLSLPITACIGVNKGCTVSILCIQQGGHLYQE